MTLVDQIKTAPSPRAAMLLLAEAIDALGDQVNEYGLRLDALPTTQSADPWESWGDEPAQPSPAERTLNRIDAADQMSDKAEALRATNIAAVKEQIASTADPEDRRALEARLRLLQDEGGVIESPVAEGQRVKDDQPTVAGSPTQAISVGGGTVELPVVSPARQQFRREWALNRTLHEFIPLSEDEACEQYAKGGPMWLYLGNRPAVMAMPFAWRQELVEEIAKDSPAEAQEVGRDILKSVESADRQITEIAVNGV